jgi:hypothetical protein
MGGGEISVECLGFRVKNNEENNEHGHTPRD